MIYIKQLLMLIILINSITGLELDCLIFFGDSLSDPGNLHSLTLGMYPDKRYFNGRYSNGPVWAEYILDMIKVKKSENWAYAGATTDNGITAVSKIIPSVHAQLNWFKVKNNNCYSSKSKKHLVSYIAGGNNYINAKITPQVTVNNIKEHLLMLINELKFTNILLTDIPPIGETPSFTAKWLKEGETSGSVHNDPNIKQKVETHNKLMSELVNTLTAQYPRVNLYFWQFQKFWPTAISSNPFNSTNWNTELPCFDDSEDKLGCKNSEDYFFFDTFHPITQVHKLMAGSIFKFLKRSWGGKCPKD
jgi:hypothetical protein